MRKCNDAARPPGQTLDAVAPHVIHPDAVYSIEQAQATLRLKSTTLRTEIKKRRLRVAKRANRFFILGRWLIEWLEGGELRRKAAPGDPCHCADDAEVNSRHNHH